MQIFHSFLASTLTNDADEEKYCEVEVPVFSFWTGLTISSPCTGVKLTDEAVPAA